MSRLNRFQRGSGCFNCHCCGRLTRDTGETSVGCELCVQCFEVAGIENGISDGHYETPEKLEAAHAEIRLYEAEAASKGGFLGKYAANRVLPPVDATA